MEEKTLNGKDIIKLLLGNKWLYLIMVAAFFAVGFVGFNMYSASRKEYGRTLGISEIKLEEGMKVRVLRGQLFGFEGLIKKVMLHKRLVVITFPFGGKSIEATVGIEIVDKID